MKKSLLALAVLGAFAGAAQAQTNVTIYGSFDGGLRRLSNVDAAGNDRLTMGSNGTYNSNRLGFKGVEDLGGGLNAHFTLESGFNTGTGTLNNTENRLFHRNAFVGLGGSWGSLDLGRQLNVAYQTTTTYDPMRSKYTAIAPASTIAALGTRYDNDIKYTGAFGPVTVRAEYALGEVAGSTSTNASQSIGAVYAQGPLSVGGVYAKRDVAGFDLNYWSLGGSYAFGPARVYAGYVDQKQDTATGIDTKTKFTWVGLSYAITPAIEITPAYYRQKVDGGVAGALDGKKDLYMLSLTYAFSKRTNFYALIDYSKLDGALRVGGNAAVNQDRQTGIAAGINHLF